MIYFDTDYLIHYLVVQDKEIHRNVTRKIENLIGNGQFYISLLNLQEISFVLSKLKIESFLIEDKLSELENYCIFNYSIEDFRRAKFLASKIGFQNINDCLHTTIAENYCTELYTFNKNDFEKINAFTDLKITLF